MKTRVASTVHRLIHGPALAGACGLLVATSGSPLLAQQSTAAASIDDLQEVTIVGSRIKGVVATEALPVVVIDNELITATGAVSGDELFRNIPVLVQIFLWYFVVPKVIPAFQQVPGFTLVVLGLGFFTSARIAEQVRAGIQALPRGQRYAAMAMGLTTLQSYRYVLWPMAFRMIWPPLTSESMNLLKNSSTKE